MENKKLGLKSDIEDLIYRLVGAEGKHGHGHYHHGEVEKGHIFENQILKEDKSRIQRELKQVDEDKLWMQDEIKKIEKRLKE